MRLGARVLFFNLKGEAGYALQSLVFFCSFGLPRVCVKRPPKTLFCVPSESLVQTMLVLICTFAFYFSVW
jgi:hypothetical protein